MSAICSRISNRPSVPEGGACSRSAGGSLTFRNVIGVAIVGWPFRRSLDDILFSRRTLQTDGAFRFELAHHCDDLLLRRVHFFDLDGPQGFHVLPQHLAAALAH